MNQPPIAALKAELFKALAHPARVRVLEILVDGERPVGELADLALVDGERPVGELADLLGIELSHLSQQLAVLRRAGVVITRRAGTTVYYSLRDPRTSQLLAVARQLLLANLEDSQQLLADLQDDALQSPDDSALGADPTPHAGRVVSRTP